MTGFGLMRDLASWLQSAQLRIVERGRNAFSSMDPAKAHEEANRLAAIEEAMMLTSQLATVLHGLGIDPDDVKQDSILDLGEEREQRGRPRLPDGPAWHAGTLKSYVFEALQELGGSAHLRDIRKRTIAMLDGRLTKADLDPAPSSPGESRVEYSVSWALTHLKKEGKVISIDGRGHWRLSA
jgi:hypothetical protein